MSSEKTLTHYVESYGDLLFHLCSSVLKNPLHAQIALKSILRKIQATPAHRSFEVYERSWVLKIAYELLLQFFKEHGYQISAEEQIQLDSNPTIEQRFAHFDSYFHRLSMEDQILLILKDQLQLPYPEISGAMSMPVESLKMKRQLALRTLQDWLWGGRNLNDLF
ncbi:MAG: RNA polymerase sigma factor [Bdellovibrionia bacterium]